MRCWGCEIDLPNFSKRIRRNPKEFLKFLQMHGVLKSVVCCPTCGDVCKPLPGGFDFRCQRVRIGSGLRINKCNFSQPMVPNEWMMGSDANLKKISRFVCMWLLSPQPRIDLLLELGLSSTTVARWSNYCREICLNSQVMNNNKVIGGVGKTVEIGELKFGKWKNNVGRDTEESWIIGGLERETKKNFFELVHDRSAGALIEVILRRISPGTTIISGRWKGYDPLINHSQYSQLTVDHRLNFIDPQSGNGTQNIERIWQNIYSNIPRSGRNKNLIEGYLAEFFWKSKFRQNSRLHNFFLEVARQSDPNSASIGNFSPEGSLFLGMDWGLPGSSKPLPDIDPDLLRLKPNKQDHDQTLAHNHS